MDAFAFPLLQCLIEEVNLTVDHKYCKKYIYLDKTDFLELYDFHFNSLKS